MPKFLPIWDNGFADKALIGKKCRQKHFKLLACKIDARQETWREKKGRPMRPSLRVRLESGCNLQDSIPRFILAYWEMGRTPLTESAEEGMKVIGQSWVGE